MKDKKSFKSPLGNAAKMEQQQLLAGVLAKGTEAFMRKANIQQGAKALHINCNSDKVTQVMSELIGDTGQLSIIDCNDDTFFQLPAKPAFHLIHCRYLFSRMTKQEFPIEQLFQWLHPQGILITEDLDLRKMNCFPYSYAFDRFKELLRELYKRDQRSNRLGHDIKAQLKAAGFEQIQIKFHAPVFLKGVEKRLSSLTFESIMAHMLHEKLAAPSEIHALLTELKAFEKEEYTMISLPGIYQIKAHRP